MSLLEASNILLPEACRFFEGCSGVEVNEGVIEGVFGGVVVGVIKMLFDGVVKGGFEELFEQDNKNNPDMPNSTINVKTFPRKFLCLMDKAIGWSYALLLFNFNDRHIFNLPPGLRGIEPQPAFLACVWMYHIPPGIKRVGIFTYDLKLLIIKEQAKLFEPVSGSGPAVGAVYRDPGYRSIGRNWPGS